MSANRRDRNCRYGFAKTKGGREARSVLKRIDFRESLATDIVCY